MHWINTQKISQPISVFNVDGTTNKTSQISRAVDIVLQYKTHLKQMLLTVSSLGKQNLILEYPWLKNHDLEVNQEKEKVEITCYLPRCNNYRDL